jgi:hypothetical protein
VRYFFKCPNPTCKRLCEKLYFHHSYSFFACRVCHGLTYQSCRRPKIRKRPSEDALKGLPKKRREKISKAEQAQYYTMIRKPRHRWDLSILSPEQQ